MLNAKDPPYNCKGDKTADDTAGLEKVIQDAKGDPTSSDPVRQRGQTIIIPDGVYMHSGLTLPARTTLIGSSVNKACLMLLPGVNKSSIVNASPTDDYIMLRDLTIDGNRRNQIAGSQTCHGIALSLTNTSGPDTDYRHRYEDLLIENCAGDGFRTNPTPHIPRGEWHIRNMAIYNVNGTGLNLSLVDSRLVNIAVGACGNSCYKMNCYAVHMVACKAYWGGMNATKSPGDMANWNIDGWGCLFTSCESQECYGSGWYITGGNHQFTGCRADDSGDLNDPGQGLGKPQYGKPIAGFYLDGGPTQAKCQDNLFLGCRIGMALDGFVSWMTAAVYITGNANHNQGAFYTQRVADPFGSPGKAPAYAQAKVVNANVGGKLDNTFTVDGVPLA